MPLIMYALGIVLGLYFLSLGVKDGNIVGGAFFGLLFVIVCSWVGSRFEPDDVPPRS